MWAVDLHWRQVQVNFALSEAAVVLGDPVRKAPWRVKLSCALFCIPSLRTGLAVSSNPLHEPLLLAAVNASLNKA